MRALSLLETVPALDAGDGAELDAAALSLADFHVLAACVCRLFAWPLDEAEAPCRNCGASLRFEARSFEWAPYQDGEADDAELDGRLDLGQRHPIPPVRCAGKLSRSIQLADRTAADVAGLLRNRKTAPLTAGTVAALGIVRLGQERRASVIAHALASASDDAWSAIGALWQDAHLPLRLVAHTTCSCGARNEQPMLARTAIDAVAPTVAGPVGSAPGLTLAAFEDRVRTIQPEVYEARGIRELLLMVDEGPPACDDGGEPLLGAYTPPGEDPLLGPQPPEVRLFYRSFAAESELDPGFDLDAEIRETIDHEVEHHLYFLAGHDPMDAEERAAIAADTARTVGRSELVRRTARDLQSDVVGFAKVGWPLLGILFVLAWLQFCRH